MGLFNNWPAIRRIVQLVIIQLFCWLACSVSFCFAQLDISEGVTGSVNFPSALALTCVGNLAVFVTTLIRGRLDLEIGARDALGILLGPKLYNINDLNGNGLATLSTDMLDRLELDRLGRLELDTLELDTLELDMLDRLELDRYRGRLDVVMLSNSIQNSSMREFMKSNAPIVNSVLLQFRPLRDPRHLGDSVGNVQQCDCRVCKCIVFWTREKIGVMLARRMPGTLKQLSQFRCLLPCLTCLRNGCHGCNGGLLHTEEDNRLTEGNSIVQSPAEPHVVCRILEEHDAKYSIRTGEPFCICIPLNDSENDKWTELLIRSFRSKDAEGRGVRVNASEALEGYLAGSRGRKRGRVEYSIASFIVPRLTEILINIVLTILFKVDGFSSSLVARRTVRDYIVDSKGSGFAANAFLTKAVVKCDAENTCQLLSFRGNVVGIRTVSFTVGWVNVVCCIVWAVLIAFDGGADASPPPSMPRVAVILAAIGIASAMNFLMFSAGDLARENLTFTFCPWLTWLTCCLCWFCCDIYAVLFFTVIHMEMMCFLSGSIVAATLGTKAFGKWLYSAVQILVFLKWTVGCFILDVEISNEFFRTPSSWEFFGLTPSTWNALPYSSAFLLNGVLAGVRSTWGPWIWKDNHLWSTKFLH